MSVVSPSWAQVAPSQPNALCLHPSERHTLSPLAHPGGGEGGVTWLPPWSVSSSLGAGNLPLESLSASARGAASNSLQESNLRVCAGVEAWTGWFCSMLCLVRRVASHKFYRLLQAKCLSRDRVVGLDILPKLPGACLIRQGIYP